MHSTSYLLPLAPAQQGKQRTPIAGLPCPELHFRSHQTLDLQFRGL